MALKFHLAHSLSVYTSRIVKLILFHGILGTKKFSLVEDPCLGNKTLRKFRVHNFT